MSFEHVDSWQKSCILGPSIFNIPQPNWHYCVHELHLMSKFYKIQFKKINEWAMVSFRTVCDIFTFPSSRHLSFSFSPVKKDIVSFVSREFSWFLGCRLLPRTERLMFHLKLSRIRDGTVCSSSKSKPI